MALVLFMEVLLAGALGFLIAIRQRRLNRNAAVTTWPGDQHAARASPQHASRPRLRN